jgi:hypothetical protein
MFHIIFQFTYDEPFFRCSICKVLFEAGVEYVLQWTNKGTHVKLSLYLHITPWW